MKTQKKSTASKPKTLNKRDQKATNGGSLLGNDNSSLSTSIGLNISSSSTDDDGQTESNSFGGNLGSSTQSLND